MANTILHDGTEFRALDDWPGYAVSAGGVVVSGRTNGGKISATWRVLKLRASVRGYKAVTLRNRGDCRQATVHRLVLESWVGPCPAGCECRHLNGDKLDNRLENLCWGTSLENKEDRRRHGTTASGSRQGHAKLTESDIPVIRLLLSSGKTQQAIARQFGVHRVTISLISRGKTWLHV